MLLRPQILRTGTAAADAAAEPTLMAALVLVALLEYLVSGDARFICRYATSLVADNH